MSAGVITHLLMFNVLVTSPLSQRADSHGCILGNEKTVDLLRFLSDISMFLQDTYAPMV